MKTRAKKKEGGNRKENVTQPVGLAAPPALIATSKQQENHPKVFELPLGGLEKWPLIIAVKWLRLSLG